MQTSTTSISMLDAERMIIACYKRNKPLMLLGKPGMGKTSLFEHVCKLLGIGFIDFRLTLRDPVDVGGMRVPDPETGMMRHYIPEDLPDPERHGPKGIILFDEINVVAQLMQAAAYGLIQERRSGSYRMADGWVPMASGNNTFDRAAAQKLSSALANRFNVQRVEPSLNAWLEQYGAEHVDTRGTAFLRFRPELFSVMPGEPIRLPGETEEHAAGQLHRSHKDQTAFPSARSWTNAFEFIDEDPTFRAKVFLGYVGQFAADEFEAFWRIMESAPSIAAIEDDPEGVPIPDDNNPGLAYAVSGMLASALTRKNIGKIAIYVERLQADYTAAMYVDAVRRDPGLKKTAQYGAFAVKHQDLLY